MMGSTSITIEMESSQIKGSTDSESWDWSSDMICDLLNHVKEFKSHNEHHPTNFQQDSVYFYHQMRLRLAQKYANRDFGPVAVTSVSRDTIVGLSDEELIALRHHVISEESATRMGYDRVRDKIAEMRDEYEAYVNIPRCAEVTESRPAKDTEPLLLREMQEIWGGDVPFVIASPVGNDDETLSERSEKDFRDSSSAGDLADDISSTDGEEKVAKRNLGERLLHRLEYFWDHGFLGAI